MIDMGDKGQTLIPKIMIAVFILVLIISIAQFSSMFIVLSKLGTDINKIYITKSQLESISKDTYYANARLVEDVVIPANTRLLPGRTPKLVYTQRRYIFFKIDKSLPLAVDFPIRLINPPKKSKETKLYRVESFKEENEVVIKFR